MTVTLHGFGVAQAFGLAGDGTTPNLHQLVAMGKDQVLEHQSVISAEELFSSLIKAACGIYFFDKLGCAQCVWVEMWCGPLVNTKISGTSMIAKDCPIGTGHSPTCYRWKSACALCIDTLYISYIYTHWGSSMAKPKIAPFLAPKTAGKYCCSAARRVQTLWPHSTCMQMPNQEGAKGQRQSCPTLFSNVLKIPWRYYGSKTCLYMFDGPPSCGYSKRWPVPAPLRPCFADEKAASGDDHFCWKLQ